jgi:hypothetical protein
MTGDRRIAQIALLTYDRRNGGYRRQAEALTDSRATMPAPRGARRAPVWKSATCAALRSIRSTRTSSLSQRLPDRTPRTPRGAQMEGCIDGSLTSAGSACATAGRSQPTQSRLCSAPARKAESCGPQMSGACIVPMTAGGIGAAWSAMRRRRGTCAASRSCGERNPTMTEFRGQYEAFHPNSTPQPNSVCQRERDMLDEPRYFTSTGFRVQSSRRISPSRASLPGTSDRSLSSAPK